MNETIRIEYASVRVRPTGVPESKTYEHVRPGDILPLPTSGNAGAEGISVFGRTRRLGRDRYEILGADSPPVWVRMIRPQASGIVTFHWTSRHRWHVAEMLSPEQLVGIELDAARAHLTRAREDLAAALRAQDPDRHFKGIGESPKVIAAYDQVRAAEAAVARLEREGRRA